MEMNPHDLTHLFLQLGLPAERAEREAFVREHPLPPGTRLSEAAFWSPSQAEFLKRSIADNASWAAAADQLAALLSPAMPASEAD
ncbi:DUF2789 family protein [Curvibacter sp. HBC28]|uniref:DUF2789 family protein n=1 Tax=Curvibacter microcysteis TaxID=3026419 RepID=A0ABT5MCV5_9BURK|nr:DUF2789 family protein [Curvibacter sp. HBC28]MDD0814415.1 DUF2789 family protein [Curvibacter sp. HBC28]